MQPPCIYVVETYFIVPVFNMTSVYVYLFTSLFLFGLLELLLIIFELLTQLLQ